MLHGWLHSGAFMLLSVKEMRLAKTGFVNSIHCNCIIKIISLGEDEHDKEKI